MIITRTFKNNRVKYKGYDYYFYVSTNSNLCDEIYGPLSNRAKYRLKTQLLKNKKLKLKPSNGYKIGYRGQIKFHSTPFLRVNKKAYFMYSKELLAMERLLGNYHSDFSTFKPIKFKL